MATRPVYICIEDTDSASTCGVGNSPAIAYKNYTDEAGSDYSPEELEWYIAEPIEVRTKIEVVEKETIVVQSPSKNKES